MNTAESILVIITSSLLSIVLVLSIFVLVAIKRLVESLKRIAAKGEQVVENAEAAAEMFTKAAGPMSVLRTIGNIVDTVHKHKKGK